MSWSMGWVMEVVLGGQKISSAVVQDEDHLPVLSGEDPVLLMNPGAKNFASRPGLRLGMKLHWQLMDVDPLLAEDVWLASSSF